MTNQLASIAKQTIERRVQTSAALLERMGITPEAYERVALNALIHNPKLVECDRRSLDVAIADCIQAGLLPDGKQASIVPFGKNATVVPMIEGRIMLARRATPGLSLRVRVVYEDDEWRYHEGLKVALEHTPNPKGSKRDSDIIAAYAVALIPGATEPEFEVMDRQTLDRYQSYSRASRNDAPWEKHYAEMAKKAVLGQLLKRLPKDPRAPIEPQMPAPFEAGYAAGVLDIETGEIPLPAPEPEPEPVEEVLPFDDDEEPF